MLHVLMFLMWLFTAFAVCHYSLSKFFKNDLIVSLVSAVFAVLVAVFAPGLLQ